jgi:heme-degrading monooxygenase HmoA
MRSAQFTGDARLSYNLRGLSSKSLFFAASSPGCLAHRYGKGSHSMYIAMNRFKVTLGSEAAFEHLWTSRDTHLKEVPGFVEFHLLKGPQKEDHVLYSSHTIWSDHAAFEGWTKSEAFRAAHRNAGNDSRVLYLGHPEFEGFEVIQTVK